MSLRSAGLEPATLWFEARCSIQLSYDRMRSYYVAFFSLSLKAFSSFFTFGIATAAT
jgi:hypothetical protein